MKLFHLLFIITLTTIHAFSQNQGNIWYFGDQAGLDFNNGAPIAITDGQTYNDSETAHSEGTTVICDNTGSLLFYSNGEKVWNGNHEIMPNGDGLLGNLSSTQTLIVPQPGSSQLYYLFTTDGFFESNLENGLRYSVIDICLDNGNGDVMDNKKNILITEKVAEKLTAVRHSNGIDYWVITHKYNSDAFHAYLLSSEGIVDSVITRIGSIHKDYCPGSTAKEKAALGQMKASPDASKLVCVNGQGCKNISELFDFDQTTGIVTNVLDLQTDILAIGLYGASFSPDNSKLYISSWVNSDKVYQYDLSLGIPETIVNSKTIVGDHSGGPWFMGMQLGPDGKIYIAIRNQNSIAVIDNPNAAGTSCNLMDDAISLDGKSCSLALPNFIDFYDYSNTSVDCTTGTKVVLPSIALNIYPNPFTEVTTIELNNLNIETPTLMMYDNHGKVVKIIHNIKGGKLELNRQNLPDGLYLVQLKSNAQILTTKKLLLH